MSYDYKGDCKHDYCPAEYCMERGHLVPNHDPLTGARLFWLRLTYDQRAVLEYVLSGHAAQEGQRSTAIDVILDEIQDI